MSKSHKIILKAVITGVFAVFLGFFITSEVRADEAVPYIIRSWDDSNKKLTVSTGSCNDYSSIDAYNYFWDGTNNNWYVVAANSNVTIDNRINVYNGTVNLILCDGATLTAKRGITVNAESGLNIYAQSGGTGTLLAGTDGNVDTTQNSYAGIGGSDNEDGGTIKIYGGNVTAVGGTGAAGIGGGKDGNGGTIEIYNGNVRAIGRNNVTQAGAGIGGGDYGNGGNITIYGGAVYARSEKNGAGIGGGHYNDGGNITIYSGTVYAYGGENGAGIGGGIQGPGGDITINGGIIYADGGDYGAGIGGGFWGSGGNITINGGIVTASGGVNAKGIGKGEDGNNNNDGSLTLGSGVELYTSDDNSNWSDPTTSTDTRTRYMKTITPISYMNWDGTNNKLVAASTGTTDYTTVAGQLTWGTAGTTTWYVLRNDVQIDSRITVAGIVNLILCDGKTLTATKGITVQDDDNNLETTSPNTLNIYGQSEGTGILYAGTSNGTNVTTIRYNAGIGGEQSGSGGSVTINGGTVTATGGDRGAGIGSGTNGGPGGSATINGGTLTINGGIVNATGGYGAAGIGGGYSAAGGSITINGGTVTATGGQYSVGNGGGYGGTIDHGTLILGTGVKLYFSTNNSEWTDTTDRPSTRTQYMKTYAPISYLKWDDTSKKLVSDYVASDDCTTVTSDMSTTWNTGWYVVKDNITINTRITVNGTVNLILCDGKTLTAEDGITTAGATFNIYGQSEGTGKLYSGTTDGINVTAVPCYAGIGGGMDGAGGTITINGGTVIATGAENGAGIGGGMNGAGGTITINGGTVIATGAKSGAGIGGGYGGTGGSITINGGSVTATGGENAAGIGGGSMGAGGNITINGGSVTATGGEGGAGIGGGLGELGGTITINGGITIATGGNEAPGIGGENGGTLTLDTDVGVYTSDDGIDWSDTTQSLSTRKQYMKAFISIPYKKWNDSAGKLVQDYVATDDCTTVTTSMSTTWNTGWYVVKDNITINDRITVNGTVNLILCDGKTLTAPKGVTVQDIDPDTESTNILNIYGQILGSGALKIDNVDRGRAGIGSLSGYVGGTIRIDGGKLTITGGEYGAGIGGGHDKAGGNITINGGSVTATGGHYGAGIGGGYMGTGGSITINGGSVTATGGTNGGAGIGGGEYGAGGTIEINGGTVVAYGGNEGTTKAGAGIGGGAYGEGGNITINGGTVIANGGGNDVVGIGGGNGSTIVHGTLTLGSGVYVFAKADGTPATTGDPLTIDTDRKVTGDRQQYMKSVLQYVVTFKVVNGSWNDGTNADKIVRLTRGENEDLLLKLSDSDIPIVGTKPAGGYTAGSWDVTPTTELAINEDKTYTYTYTYTQPIHNHSYTGRVTKPATCKDTGVMTYTCSCGESYTRSIPVDPDNHSFDEGKVTKPATVVSDGLKTFTCTRCGAIKTELIPKLDPATEEEKDLAEQIETLIEDLKDETGELKVEVDVKTEKKDDGTTETIVTVGGEEVVKIITDEDGEEKIESNIWSIGGDGVYTYTGLAIKPDVQVYDGLKKLSAGSDYSVSYKNNINAGTKAEAKVSFKGGYKGTPAIKANFTIDPADLSKDATAVGMVIAANGKAQKPIPEITLKSSGKSLGKGDLKYRYLDSKGEVVSGIKEVGDYTVEAKGKKDKGNFTGVASATITVTGDKTKVLSNGKVKLTKKSYTYTGKPIIPEKGTYTLTLDGTELKEGEDYTLKVKNNVDPGKATMIFTAADENKGGYVGSINATFKIDKGKELKAAGEGSDFTYIYKENVPFSKGGAKPELIVKDEETVLTPGKDYAVSYSNNTKVTDGKDAVITVKGKGIYIGKVTLNYAVIGQDIATLSGNIVVSDKAVSKKGYKDPAVTITDMDGKKLAKDKDYALSDDYTTPDENGVITVTVIGKGNYSGSVPVSYRYLNKNAMLDNVKASKIPDKVYTGSRIRLTKKELAKLLYTGNVKNPTYLVEGKDFEVVGYSNNLKTGTAKVTLRGIGDRGGTKTVSFKIVASKKSIINVIVGAIKK